MKSLRKKTARVKWTEQMEKTILDYAKLALANGEGFEKPGAPDYYKKFLENNSEFPQVPVNKLVEHMRNMKRSYVNALQWRGQTGQGILESDPVSGQLTVEGELLKRCKYFKELDELLGDKPQFNPPCVLDVGEIESFDYVDPNNDLILDIESSEPDPLIVVDKTETQETKRMVEEMKPIPARKKLKCSPVKSAVEALQSAMKMRSECESKRLEWEKACEVQKLNQLTIEKHSEIEFKREQLQFEKNRWEREFEQAQLNDQQKHDLEKLKLQMDAEIEKLKIEKQFELEKMKLGLL